MKDGWIIKLEEIWAWLLVGEEVASYGLSSHLLFSPPYTGTEHYF